MATRIATANGNLTTAGTWATADATSLLVSSANNTNLTTSYVASSTFTPGAITIDGIAIWVNTRLGATGTISVALDQATVTVAGTEVTIDVADIPADGNCWVLFKFAAPVLLLAATAYSVKAKTSSATQVNLFRNATANNWSRLLRTTTTGAPGAADNLYVLGEKTGSGAQTTRTVTMDDAAAGATVYGQIDISAGGTMTYGTTAATAYFLKIAGDMNVRAGGTLNLGTAGTPMPASSSGVLEFNCGSNAQFGLLLKAGGVLVGYGNAIANVKAKLDADAAATATALTTDVATGWKNGDEIAIAPTTRTAGQAEKKSLSADAVGTGLTTAALTNAHSGSGATKAALINLTRNVKIRGVSASLQAYIVVEDKSSFTIHYVEIYQMGSNDSTKLGLRVNSASAGSVLDIQFCSWHDFAVSLSGVNFQPATTIAIAIVVSHNVSYSISRSHVLFTDAAVGAGSVTFSDHVGIRVSGSIDPVVEIQIAEAIVSDIVVSGGAGSGAPQLIINGKGGVFGSFTNLTAHSGGSSGIGIFQGLAGPATVFSNLTAWRNNAAGIMMGLSGDTIGLLAVSVTGTNVAFGNLNENVVLRGRHFNNTFWNFVCDGEGSFTTAVGIATEGGGATFCSIHKTRFMNALCGVTTAHFMFDVQKSANSRTIVHDLKFINPVFASAGEIDLNFQYPGESVLIQRRDQASGQHKGFFYEGTIAPDTTIFDLSPSVRLTPAQAAAKLELNIRRVMVPNGATKTVTVKVRCSVIGDGAAYNGNRPRLVQKAQPGAGSSADVVLDTATVASDGAFETLTGTIAAVTDDCVITFVVDCDGTAGWVNVDTMTVS